MEHESISDFAAVALARLLEPGDFVGVGLGTPLALVAALLGRQLHAELVHVLAGGALDVEGDVDVWLGGAATTLGRTPGYVPHLDSMDMAERQSMTVQFLRPAQVDGAGNLNTSRIGTVAQPTFRFPGGLATADVPSLLPRVIAYLPDHRQRNLPGQVAWTTAKGRGWSGGGVLARGVTSLVTNRAIIDFTADGPALRSVHPWSSPEDVAEHTGFIISGLEGAEMTKSPTPAEESALRRVDPRRRRDVEVKAPVAA